MRWTERAKSCALSTTILRIVDSDGVEGLAGCDSYQFGRADRSILEAVRSIWPWLEGRTTECREALVEDNRVGVVFPFSTGPLALLDIALWDLAARRAGLPLWKMLGGAQERLPSGRGVSTMETESEYLEVVGKARDEGIRAVKLHAFGDPDRDVALFAKLRVAYPDLELMHDAESAYDRLEALRWARAGRARLPLVRGAAAGLRPGGLPGSAPSGGRADPPAGYSMWDIRQMADALRDPPWTTARAEISAPSASRPCASRWCWRRRSTWIWSQ